MARSGREETQMAASLSRVLIRQGAVSSFKDKEDL